MFPQDFHERQQHQQQQQKPKKKETVSMGFFRPLNQTPKKKKVKDGGRFDTST